MNRKEVIEFFLQSGEATLKEFNIDIVENFSKVILGTIRSQLGILGKVLDIKKALLDLPPDEADLFMIKTYQNEPVKNISEAQVAVNFSRILALRLSEQQGVNIEGLNQAEIKLFWRGVTNIIEFTRSEILKDGFQVHVSP